MIKNIREIYYTKSAYLSFNKKCTKTFWINLTLRIKTEIKTDEANWWKFIHSLDNKSFY